MIGTRLNFISKVPTAKGQIPFAAAKTKNKFQTEKNSFSI